MKTDVVIIGAGPVGLTAALLLARHGLRVVLLERGASPDPRPGAVCVDDESMRIWQACGVEQDLRPHWAAGDAGSVVCRYSDRHGRDFMTLRHRVGDAGFPQAVVIRQPVITEVLWRAAMRTRGIRICTQSRFAGIRQQDDSVLVEATHASGDALTIRAEWVIGCDGRSSSVRSAIGVVLPEVELRESWLVADIAVTGGTPCAEIRCGPSSTSVTVPLPGGYRRIERMLAPGDDGSWIRGEHTVRTLLSSVWPGAASGAIDGWRVCRFHAGVAGSWRVGRVFLAGDAAHVTPPFAAQGLGSGLRDAANLCFKLAGVSQGWLPELVLDTYEQERRPHAARVIRLALRLGALMSPPTAWIASLEQAGLRFLTHFESVRRRIEMRGPAVSQRYERGFVGAGPMCGRLLPQPDIDSGKGSQRLDSILGNRMTWLVLGTDGSPGDASGIDLKETDSLLVEGRDFVDRSKILQRTLGCGSRVLVRPDRVIHTHIRRRSLRRLPRKGQPWTSPLHFAAQS